MKVQPEDIDAGKHFFDAFDEVEREISARWIVAFCQQRGQGWEPFTLDDIERFYNERGYKRFLFNGLIDPRYGIEQKRGAFQIKHEFVARCWLASPAERGE